jgi:hypothetical protein
MAMPVRFWLVVSKVSAAVLAFGSVTEVKSEPE